MKNATTILGLSPKDFFERMWRLTNVYRRPRGEAHEYIWGHEGTTPEQESEMERARVVEYVTIGLKDDAGEIIPVEFQIVAHRLRKEEPSERIYRDYIITLTSGDEDAYHVGDALYIREYQDEDLTTQLDRETDNWKAVFSSFLTSANLAHYKNTTRRLRKCQELFRDTTTEMMKAYLTK